MVTGLFAGQHNTLRPDKYNSKYGVFSFVEDGAKLGHFKFTLRLNKSTGHNKWPPISQVIQWHE